VVNLLRDPRGCRNAEGCSEDPVHTARLGTAYCAGLAGGHPTCLRAAAVLKHFLACDNEDDRCVTSSGLRPRVLQEYDLAAFRPVVASGAATGAMAAYHLVNGRPCHVSPLIETELRSWSPPTGHVWFAVSDAEAPSNLRLPLRPRLGRRAPARRGADVLRRAGDRLGAGRRTARRGRPHGRAAADLVSGRRRVSDFPFEE
jgi:beta-glucosidase